MFSFFRTLLPFDIRKYFLLNTESFAFHNNTKRDLKNEQSFLFPKSPLKNLVVSVILPVKNEALCLVNTLDALRNQVDDTGKSMSYMLYEVLLLANNCTDASFSIAKEYQQKHPQFQLHIANIFLPKSKAHIGTVRRMLMDEAYRRHQLNNCDGIIASTDGDTEVDAQWLYYTIKEIDKGNHVVGGRILSKTVDKKVRSFYLRDVAYRYLSARLESEMNPCSYNPWPSHFQCFGASMAVLCSVYQKAGRLPVVPYLEDEAFCKVLNRMDLKIRKSPLVKVYTSSRMEGRVKVGFSAHLKHLHNMRINKHLHCVESAEELKIKLTNKKQLCALWQTNQVTKISKSDVYPVAKALYISVKWLYRRFNKVNYFGELWEEVEARVNNSRKWRKQYDYVMITDAISGLRIYLNH